MTQAPEAAGPHREVCLSTAEHQFPEYPMELSQSRVETHRLDPGVERRAEYPKSLVQDPFVLGDDHPPT